MVKRVLLIDNESVKDYFEILSDSVNSSQNSPFDIECQHFNPVDRKFENEEREIDFEISRKELIEEYLQQKIDVIGCDFNLHETNKSLTFDIVKTIRQYNSTSQLFIYSGAMNRELLKIFEAEGKNPAEKLLQTALSSNIVEFVNSRNMLPSKILELLTTPTIGLIIENFLLENAEFTIKRSYEQFKGKQLFEIANEIRINSTKGIEFISAIVDHGLSHMIDLNDYE